MMSRVAVVSICLLSLLTACTPPAAETTVALNLGVIAEPPPPPPPPAPAVNTCQVDVGRTDDTKHPNEAMQAHVQALNDKFRALIGWDVFVGEDGGRAVIDCTIGPGHEAKATSQGLVVPVYQLSGMPPLNYFLEQQRPGISGVIGHNGKALQILPFQLPVATDTVADFNTVADLLPKPSFSFSPLETGVPGASVAVVPGGTYQINDVVRFEVTPVDPAVAANLAVGTATNIADAAIRVRQTVVVGPDGCAWAGCADRVPNVQDRTTINGTAMLPAEAIEKFLAEVQRLVEERQAVGTPVVAAEILHAALTTYDHDISNWLDLRYDFISGVTTPEIDAALSAELTAMDPTTARGFVRKEFTIPLLVLTPDYLASGGGGCGKGGGGCSLLLR